LSPVLQRSSRSSAAFSTSPTSKRVVSPGTRTTLAASSTGITPRGPRRSPWSVPDRNTTAAATAVATAVATAASSTSSTSAVSATSRPHRQVPPGSGPGLKSCSQPRLPQASQADVPPPSPGAPENRRCQSVSSLESPALWAAAKQCWKVLDLLDPLKASLTGVLKPAGGGRADVKQPPASDVEKLRGRCTDMAAAMKSLQKVLNDPAGGRMPEASQSDGGTGSCAEPE
ncbi:unnamed protein product, partial [Symbiodinium pilosum]